MQQAACAQIAEKGREYWQVVRACVCVRVGVCAFVCACGGGGYNKSHLCSVYIHIKAQDNSNALKQNFNTSKVLI